MEVTETSSDGLKRELKVILSNSEIEEKLEYRLQELGRTTTLPGFRPGKAPIAMLRKRYGQSVLGDIVQGAVADGSSQAMSERGLRPAMQPEVEITKFEEGADLEFLIKVEILPEITPMDFGTVELERLVIEVSDQEVDSALEHLAGQQKDAAPVTEARPAKTGDILHIAFVGRIDGTEFPGGSTEAHRLELGSSSFVPGFEEQLIGTKAGDHLDVTITFPAEYGNAELAGKEAVFEVDVKELLETVEPEINDAFAQKIGAPDLAALKAQLRERIEGQYADVARDKLKRELFDKLAESHDFPVPPQMLDREFENIWKQVEEDRAKGEVPEEDADKSDDDLKAEYLPIAERRIRLGLLLSDVGESNGIQLTQDEISRAIMEEAQRHPGQEREVLDYYQKNPDAAAAMRAPLFENKVVDFLIEKSTVTDRTITVEELVAETHDHDHDHGGKKQAAGKKSAKAKKPAAKKKTAAKTKGGAKKTSAKSKS